MSLLVQNRKDFLSVPSKNRLLELFTVQSMLKIAIILGKNGFFMYFFVKTGLHLLHLIPNFLLLTIENNCSKLNKMTLLILILFSQCIVNLVFASRCLSSHGLLFNCRMEIFLVYLDIQVFTSIVTFSLLLFRLSIIKTRPLLSFRHRQ